jgi:alpha-galactosidase
MLKHFGAFPTESSHHMSEYLPYFRTDEEHIEELTGTSYAERMPTATYLEGWKARSAERDRPELAVDLDDLRIDRSEEYAARLIHSIETGTQRRFNLNVPNESNAIENLPNDACVEVPVYVDGSGIHPAAVGRLPAELAALNRQHTTVYELAVGGALEGNREKVHQAVKLDPLSSAACSLDELHEMTEELLVANEPYLPTLEWPDSAKGGSHHSAGD